VALHRAEPHPRRPRRDKRLRGSRRRGNLHREIRSRVTRSRAMPTRIPPTQAIRQVPLSPRPRSQVVKIPTQLILRSRALSRMDRPIPVTRIQEVQTPAHQIPARPVRADPLRRHHRRITNQISLKLREHRKEAPDGAFFNCQAHAIAPNLRQLPTVKRPECGTLISSQHNYVRANPFHPAILLPGEL
jgi:hypothetical protein